MTAVPQTIPAYLAELRAALQGADPALIQDALYDAEEYLRSELADNPGKSEAEVIAAVASSYGAPSEVAEIYRDTETRVSAALRAPPPPQRKSSLGRFFGVAVEARTYSALFYLILSLATGILYFTVAVTGLSLSIGLSVLIIGIPFVILFFGLVRVLSLVEGRLVEVMLGVRMPRRPLYTARGKPFGARVKAMFSDPRTWSTLLYMILQLPLGIIYFVICIAGFVVPLSLMGASVVQLFWHFGWIHFHDRVFAPPIWTMPFIFAISALVLFGVLHLIRGLGLFHSQLAKQLLVKTAQYG